MSDEKQISDHEKLAQMLERIMPVAEILAQRSQPSSDNASASDEKHSNRKLLYSKCVNRLDC